MAEYTPVALPGDAYTLNASAAVTAGRNVAVSGNATVAPAVASTTAKVVGVAAFDAGANADVTVYLRGPVHEVTATGAITAGDQVSSAANGTVASTAVASGATAGDINTARGVIGLALTTAADGALVRYMSL